MRTRSFSVLLASWPWLVLLGAVWLLGVAAHTTVFTFAMPGLTRRHALMLRLSGSAVSNVLPLGDVAAAGLNLGMVRAWGHSRPHFARFVVVSKTWDLAARLVMPIVALTALLLWHVLEPNGWTLLWLLGATGSGLLAVVVVGSLFGRAAPLQLLAGLLERPYRRVARRPPATTWSAGMADLVADTRHLVRRRWRELTLAMCGYWLLQAILLGLSLGAAGAWLPWPVVLAGLTAERVMTLLALALGGAGLVETATIAVLVAFGTNSAAAVAGVLLFRGFVFVAEIPVGGVAIALWLLARRPSVRGQTQR